MGLTPFFLLLIHANAKSQTAHPTTFIQCKFESPLVLFLHIAKGGRRVMWMKLAQHWH